MDLLQQDIRLPVTSILLELCFLKGIKLTKENILTITFIFFFIKKKNNNEKENMMNHFELDYLNFKIV